MNQQSVAARINRVRYMPYGVSREEAALAIVRDLEASTTPTELPYAYFALVEAYTFGKNSERSYVPFTKMIRLWDEHPEAFDSYDKQNMFWSFKWMISELSDYHTVPAAQIEATLDDMARRFAIAGNGMDGVEHQRFLWAWLRESPDMTEAYDRWVRTPRDEFSQCEACDPGDRAAYLFEVGRIEEGIRLVEPVLLEDPSCSSEPADMLSRLQFAYLEAGRNEDAIRTHRRGISHLTTEFGPRIGSISRHIEFLAVTRNFERALHLLKQHQQFLLDGAETPLTRLSFLIHVGSAIHILASQEDLDPSVELNEIPATTLAELDGWIKSEAKTLANLFDSNHGTDTQHLRVERAWERTALSEQLDVSVAIQMDISASESVSPSPSESPAAQTPIDAESSRDSVSIARELRARASECSHSDPGGSSELYGQAANAYRSSGYLSEAAECLEQAAHLAQKVGDNEVAARAFEQAAGLWSAQGENLAGQFSLVYLAVQAYAILDKCDSALHTLTQFMESSIVREALAGASTILPLNADAAHSPSVDSSKDEESAGIKAANAKVANEYRAIMVDLEARVHAQNGNFLEADTLAFEAAEQLVERGLIAQASFSFMLMGKIRRDNLSDLDGALWAYESAAEGFSIAHELAPRNEALGAAIGILRTLERPGEADELAAKIGTSGL